MPARELAHRLGTNMLQAFLARLLILGSSLVVAQTISSVSVSKKAEANQQSSEFILKVSGKDFGTDKSKVSVVVTPKKDILRPPTVTDISEGGPSFSSVSPPQTVMTQRR
jgi:hypothetical protein